VTQSYLCMQ